MHVTLPQILWVHVIAHVILTTARVKVFSPQGQTIHVRALLDAGSQVTLITSNLVQFLRLKRTKHYVLIQGVGIACSIEKHTVSLAFGPVSSDMPTHSTIAYALDSITAFTPRRIVQPLMGSHSGFTVSRSRLVLIPSNSLSVLMTTTNS